MSQRVQRVISAYTDDRPFSVDLVGAVIRQYSFVEKMDRAGWTIPGYFDAADDEVILTQAICRYHAYVSGFTCGTREADESFEGFWTF